MADLDQLRTLENLRRAWRWIKSNPDATYKSYFRPLYQQFAVAEEALLNDISESLKRGLYDPQIACKLYHPKASGILRPISLLSVGDQIVYQAAINLIAEKLQPRVVQRYNEKVFGHLYAGKTSTWFYRKWSDGYKAFNEAARAAFNNGFTYTASFDLTACYDSLDHAVLRHFLNKLGLDPEFCRIFTGWLERWTATERGIFHNHGIPQGPLSSGLLSEVVLAHFDELKIRGVQFSYYRYVDDIRLFAKNEHDLRRLLVSLDLLSKDVGLFPQSGKIGIHRVLDIEDELKSVSNPPEAAISRLFIDQKRLSKRIIELSPRYDIKDATRFKYLLAHASPCSKLTNRLWCIHEKHPEIYRNVCNYLRRYSKLPRVPAKKLVEIIKVNTLYQAVRADFINAADGRLPLDQDRALARFLLKSWAPRSMNADLQVAAGKFLFRTGDLSPNRIRYACKVAPSWWARACLITVLDPVQLGENTVKQIIDAGIKDRGNDVALAASWKSFEQSYLPPGRRRSWNRSAQLLLKEVDLIKRSSASHCGITLALNKLDSRIPTVNWKKFFGPRYSQAERQIIETVASSGMNITGFVNLLDVFNDLLIDALFQKDGSIGSYDLGKIGSALHAPTSRFATQYPRTYDYAKEVHERRYESMASHPIIQRSGKPTKRITFKFLPKAKRLLKASIVELNRIGII